jgi:hypothetical protein
MLVSRQPTKKNEKVSGEERREKKAKKEKKSNLNIVEQRYQQKHHNTQNVDKSHQMFVQVLSLSEKQVRK